MRSKNRFLEALDIIKVQSKADKLITEGYRLLDECNEYMNTGSLYESYIAEDIDTEIEKYTGIKGLFSLYIYDYEITNMNKITEEDGTVHEIEVPGDLYDFIIHRCNTFDQKHKYEVNIYGVLEEYIVVEEYSDE